MYYKPTVLAADLETILQHMLNSGRRAVNIGHPVKRYRKVCYKYIACILHTERKWRKRHHLCDTFDTDRGQKDTVLRSTKSAPSLRP